MFIKSTTGGKDPLFRGKIGAKSLHQLAFMPTATKKTTFNLTILTLT
jgi:hypothetical protein